MHFVVVVLLAFVDGQVTLPILFQKQNPFRLLFFAARGYPSDGKLVLPAIVVPSMRCLR